MRLHVPLHYRPASLLVACLIVPWMASSANAIVSAGERTALSAADARVAPRHTVGTTGAVTHVRRHLLLRRGATHELVGPVEVDAGATLVIEAGARVESRAGAGITVQRDGAIVAQGTLLEPIVMTCTSVPKYAGCWNGIRVHGYAQVNYGTLDSPGDPQGGAGGCLQASESGLAFGGCNDADSSGVLRYVRVEYAAQGLRLLGVGAGTLLENIQVNRSQADGLSMVGGTADVRFLFATANGGYGLLWRSGWRGRGQFIVVQQDAASLTGGVSGSNASSSGTGFNSEPVSAPTLFNVTVVAPGIPGQAGERPALHLRQGTRGRLRNLLVHSSNVVLDLDDGATCDPSNGSELVSIGSIVMAGNTLLGSPDADPVQCSQYTSPSYEQQLLASVNTASVVVTDPVELAALLRNPTDLTVPDLRPATGGAASTASHVTPPNDGFFDPAALFAGAVAPVVPARNNVPWYAGWTVPAPVPPAPGVVSGIVASASQGPVGNVVVSAALGVRDTTDGNGAYSLVLPAGQHVISASGLPIGCSSSPLTVNSTSGGALSANLAVDCTVAVDVAVGTLHGCLTTAGQRLQCWGQNDFGMVGDGTTVTPRLLPVQAAGNLPYDPFTLSVGLTHSCASRVSTAFCWGLNIFGALGIGTTGSFTASPIAVGSFATPIFSKVSTGGYHSCGLTTDGSAWCWGWNAEGQTGVNSTAFSVLSPTAVEAGATRFAVLALGESHSCGLTSAGAAWCWGGNGRGEAGRDTAGADLKSLVPVLVSSSLAFTAIDAGTLHTCAITADGTAYCWGSREFGQIGDGSSVGIASTPTAVNTTEKFLHIAAGAFTTCGVTTTHRVLCWGAGIAGSLGNGTNTAVQSTPVEVSPFLDARRVAVSLSSETATTACAVTGDGRVFCWGAGSAGQLGNGTTVSSNVPVQVRVRGPF